MAVDVGGVCVVVIDIPARNKLSGEIGLRAVRACAENSRDVAVASERARMHFL